MRRQKSNWPLRLIVAGSVALGGYHILKPTKNAEERIINRTAHRVGVDANLLRAIRKAEGSEKYAFGIMPNRKYNNSEGYREGGKFIRYSGEFEKQCAWSACTLRRRYNEFNSLPEDLKSKYRDFIDFLGDSYCPTKRDTSGLNVNWESNVREFYARR